jgi:hypothetical protein
LVNGRRPSRPPGTDESSTWNSALSVLRTTCDGWSVGDPYGVICVPSSGYSCHGRHCKLESSSLDDSSTCCGATRLALGKIPNGRRARFWLTLLPRLQPAIAPKQCQLIIDFATPGLSHWRRNQLTVCGKRGQAKPAENRELVAIRSAASRRKLGIEGLRLIGASLPYGDLRPYRNARDAFFAAARYERLRVDDQLTRQR